MNFVSTDARRGRFRLFPVALLAAAALIAAPAALAGTEEVPEPPCPEAAAAAVSATAEDDAAPSRCSCGRGHGHGRGAQGAGGAGCCGANDHREAIHALLARHDSIVREVERVDGGILSVTTSEDPEVAALIRKHTGEMKARVEAGQPMRHWDPLFVEIFEHHDKIVMEIEEIDGGVRVIETSADPKVAELIRQHALRGVSEFVDRGFERAHEATPLPEGYAAASAKVPQDPPCPFTGSASATR